MASGNVPAATAWPEVAPDMGEGVPTTDADLSQFELEEATPESFAKDMAAIDALTADKKISVTEPPAEHPVRVSIPDLEWP